MVKFLIRPLRWLGAGGSGSESDASPPDASDLARPNEALENGYSAPTTFKPPKNLFGEGGASSGGPASTQTGSWPRQTAHLNGVEPPPVRETGNVSSEPELCIVAKLDAPAYNNETDVTILILSDPIAAVTDERVDDSSLIPRQGALPMVASDGACTPPEPAGSVTTDNCGQGPPLEIRIPRVFLSSGNVLYLTGGSEGAASLYTEAGFRKNVDSASWSRLFANRKEAIAKSGSAFAQLIVPEKLSVYPLDDADMQRVFPGADLQAIVPPGHRLLQEIDSTSIFYPYEFLSAQSKNFPVYTPTDSHWTWQGAFSAFQALMWELRYNPSYEDFLQLPRRTVFYRGDLWEPAFTSVEADKFVRLTLPASVRRVYANAIVGLKERSNLNNEPGLHVGSHCIFTNSAAEIKQTVVLFGSSFSECRVEPSLLTAIFCYFFETVHFVWTTSVDVEYVARHKANLTVAEMPERFLTLRPDDSGRVEEMASSRIQAWKKQNTCV